MTYDDIHKRYFINFIIIICDNRQHTESRGCQGLKKNERKEKNREISLDSIGRQPFICSQTEKKASHRRGGHGTDGTSP